MQSTSLFPPAFEDLFDEHRYKVYYGGRGSGKSWAFARALLILAAKKPLRILCCRELQSSIADSVHKLLQDQITDMRLEHRFLVTKQSILGTNGSEFIFKGLRHNAAEIKSTEGIDIAWCFPGGTLVDGRPIESVRPGDMVRSFNHKLVCIEERRVLRLMERPAPFCMSMIECEGGRIICTSDHPVFVEGRGYLKARDVVAGDVLLTDAGGNAAVRSVVVSAADGTTESQAPVYNLEVEGNNNYFANRILVHNCEEAQSVSEASWGLLIPTIRKERSEIWVSFNPDGIDDPTYQKFVIHPPENAFVEKVNYDQNMWFPDVLREEMEHCRATDPEAYDNIWLGNPKVAGDAQIFKGKFDCVEFDTPGNARFYTGADWGFSCLAGDTLVTTDHGDVPLRDMKAGDMVLTRDGYRKVLSAQCKGRREVRAVDFGYDHRVIATEDHRIFTAEGWKRVDELKGEETVCMTKSNSMARCIRGIRTGSIRIISTISSAARRIGSMRSIIARYGNTIMDRFQRGVRSIISMGMRLTTTSAISCASRPGNTVRSIAGIITSINTAGGTDTPRKIGPSVGRSPWRRLRSVVAYARNAARNMSSRTCIRSIAARIAGNAAIRGRARRNMCASIAGGCSWLRHTMSGTHALRNVPISSRPLSRSIDVFDITVENGEFFANGVLVHNCDPTALVRCWIRNDELYIDYEAVGYHVDIEDTPALFDQIPTARKWPIIADSARPETISHMANKGFNIQPCSKWRGGIEDGISVMRSFRRIHIHPRCPVTLNEFKLYSYKQDHVTGETLPVVLDCYNHCIAEGQSVATSRGNIPIEDVRVGDMVMTRKGFRRVLKAWKAGVGREVVRLRAGRETLVCTPDHKVAVVGKGWIEAKDVGIGFDRVFVQSGDGSRTVRHQRMRSGETWPATDEVLVWSIEPAGVADVYDLTVDDVHEFFAGNICVSNCIDAIRYALESVIRGRRTIRISKGVTDMMGRNKMIRNGFAAIRRGIGAK